MKSSDIQRDSASVERPQFAGDTSVFFHDGNNPTILCFNFIDKQVQVCINNCSCLWYIYVAIAIYVTSRWARFTCPPATCDSDNFHDITAYIHNVHTIQALIINRAV